jgi:dolichol-phosphate mannosyltransferase
MIYKNIKKTICVVAPFFNEEDNVLEFYKRLNEVISNNKNFNFDFIFIDNSSSDNTVSILKNLAKADKRVKVILNTRNFGHIRSPYWAVMQSYSDATIYMASDLQDPPELISKFIMQWEKGYKVVMAVKPISNTGFFTHRLRKLYYQFLDSISDVKLIRDATGFGLYDKKVLDIIRDINDPYPYFRGLIAELGFKVQTVIFDQPRRLRGISKNNFYTLYDIGMLGIISHSLIPIRLASFLGFAIGLLSILIAIIFLICKIFFWDYFPMGIAPIVIGMFLFFGLILMFIGILGEYIGSIHNYLKKRPIVVEEERINF